MIKIAKLYFRYGTMASGKSLEIYKIYDNYKRQGKRAICFVPDVVGETKSRIGLKAPSIKFKTDSDLWYLTTRHLPVDCVLVDEIQFITKQHVLQLVNIVDVMKIPVIGFGLKTTFKGTIFEGSYWMIVYADKIEEVKTVCQFCNAKATMVLRIENGKPIYDGPEIQIKKKGQMDYLPVCRKCWIKPDLNKMESLFTMWNDKDSMSVK